MHSSLTSFSRRAVVALVCVGALGFAPPPAQAADAVQGIEQALSAALQDKRGITLYVNGQTVSGAVTRIEAGAWVELRNPQHGRMLVRLDRIDGIAAP